MFNEAQLRGIDLEKLREESFSSREHLKMMAEHEVFAKTYWQIVRETARPVEKKLPPKMKTVKPPVRVKTSKTYLFTPEQVSIAEAIFRKEKK